MKLFTIFVLSAVGIFALGSPTLLAATAPASRPSDESAKFADELYHQITPSLVAVKYTWESEFDKRELVGAGIVISDDGLVIVPINLVSPQLIPEGQMHDFKIVIPSETEDNIEIDAKLQGRDERAEFAYIKVDPSDKLAAAQKWKAIHFTNAPFEVGDRIWSVGLLPKASGYKSFITSAMISAKLRGPVPQIAIDGSLASVGGVVFDADARAIGYIHPRSFSDAFLDDPRGMSSGDLNALTNPPKLFVPASYFLPSVAAPPTPDKPLVLPWIGCELKGMDKEVADFFGLKNKPVVQVGDVVPGSPAEKAGLVAADIIIAMDGKPLERGDLPLELPAILTRQINWMKPGDTVTFTVIHDKDDKPKEVKLVLEPRPQTVTEAKRFYAKDLGFVVRQVVFVDRYQRKFKLGDGGVAVALLKPSGAAAAAKLEVGEVVTQMNGKPVTDIEEFKKDYMNFRKNSPGESVVLVVSQTDGREATINIEPPQTGVVPGGDQ